MRQLSACVEPPRQARSGSRKAPTAREAQLVRERAILRYGQYPLAHYFANQREHTAPFTSQNYFGAQIGPDGIHHKKSSRSRLQPVRGRGNLVSTSVDVPARRHLGGYSNSPRPSILPLGSYVPLHHSTAGGSFTYPASRYRSSGDSHCTSWNNGCRSLSLTQSRNRHMTRLASDPARNMSRRVP